MVLDVMLAILARATEFVTPIGGAASKGVSYF